MKFSIKLFFSGLLLCLVSLFSFQAALFWNTPGAVAPAQAQDIWNQQSGMDEVGEQYGGAAGDPRDVRDIVVDLIKVFLGFLAIIFLILVITAGFKWMTAGGNENQIKEAKSTLSKAIIGLIIILAAYSITEFVIEEILDATQDD